MTRIIKNSLLIIILILPNMSYAQFEGNVLSQALDNTKFDFVSDSPGFVAQTAITNFGGDAASSQNIGNDEVAVMATQFIDTLGAGGRITFDWKVSSEAGFDFLAFLILDQNENIVAQRQISGERDWSTISVPIPVGNYILAWGYVKDVASSRGSDAGYVDRVRITRTGSDLDPSCRSGRTPLNSALDNDDLEFTNFSGDLNNVSFSCEPDTSSNGGSFAVSDAIASDSSQIWTDVVGPIDVVFDWRVLSGDESFMKVQIYKGNSPLIYRGNDFFGEIVGPTDLQTFRLRVPRGEHRVRWLHVNRAQQGFGLLDNVRVEEATVDPKVLAILSSIFLSLGEN